VRRLRLWHFSIVLTLCAVSAAGSAKADPRKELMANVQQLLMQSQFDKLDAMADEFRSTDARFVGSNSKLYHLYNALGAIKASSEKCSCGGYASAFTFQEKERALKTWLKERPQSITARLGLRRLFTTYAWRGRGGAYARDVTDEQWRLFHERLQTAGSFLKGLDPKDDPNVYAAYHELAYAMGTRAELDRIYVLATRDYPQFFHFYADRAQALQEKWYGEPGELAKYTQSLLSSPGGENGQIAYTYVAGRMMGAYGQEALFEKTGLIWPLLKDAYATRARRYGEGAGELRTQLTYAIAANDREFAAAIREKLRTIGEAP
jgi:hypothetical protein